MTHMDESVEVLVISGSMGAGKTTVLGQAQDLLKEAGVEHGAIDLDLPHPDVPTSVESRQRTDVSEPRRRLVVISGA